MTEYSDVINLGFIGWIDTETLARNVTNFLHEQLYHVFHPNSFYPLHQQQIESSGQVTSLIEHLIYLLENYSFSEILVKIPEFIWTCTRESFSNESGSNAVVACFFFVSFAVMVHLILIRPLINYLFHINVEEHLEKVLKENIQDVAISKQDTVVEHLELIKLNKRFVDISNRVFKKEDDKNLTRKMIEVTHYLVTVMMILIYIPYTNMEGYWVWMCFWSYCLCSLVVFTTTVKKFRWLRRISWFYFFFPAQGLTIVANFAYLYYGLATWSFGYVFVHFVPILFMWFVLILNIREFVDEKLNFTTSSRLWNAYHLMFYLIIVTYWRFIFNPNVIYSRIILDVFLWACFLPFVINTVSFTLVSWLRKRWFDRYAPIVIRQIISSSNKKRS